jgi:hypothetical protein
MGQVTNPPTGKGNVVHELGHQLYRKPTIPTGNTGLVGDPCLVGRRPGVLLTNQKPTGDLEAGFATIKFNGSFRLTVEGVAASAGSAIAPGDDLFYDPSPGANHPNINKDSTNGTFFGVAAEAVVSGAIREIVVDLV